MADHDDKNDLDPAAQRELFWSRLDSLNSAMLGLADEPSTIVPMSHNRRDGDESALYFITAAGTTLVDKATTARDALFIVADSGGKLYARIHGSLAVIQDDAILDELWNPVAASWFEGGRQDPDIRLLKLTLSQAEVWTTTGGLGFLFELAKNKITGAIPDMGEHFTLTM